ncbi:Holliday junction ATP-dependent DNA helicase RuvA [Endomicrobiia bacterium]|uniref:Holliday junction branch migration protein RuvA n=1 Tax=Endomicrobium trichonymphae TaxID=1408204 RepID=UPI0008663032|nr:Holliday junction branch migration protein RuvA [Candidatus Endomicrobium trichonymphae]GHT04111.1 Holliday junction ATP-dependent DNA helicase RuvA [Endomicrobiia bacterium]BAV58980.1 Holliday junction resolvasome DNA-binding subunit RuvA [Candidatus Endomicrobium trichonymphae]GHT08210.1 Holliday junction ATP-dependent DNA helicase RuvA [Endomicrobiia bacterium]GHT10925.1 Holliday junction ATP-dependent DNA helicase RuvA [Endomicrobiia bacterium]GHT15951.1 Holliday junction ATP-dependent 
MIDYLYGTLDSKSTDGITIDVNGIGYEISVPISTFLKLPETRNPIKIYIVESTAGMYGGVISLYGFFTIEEREMYLLIKDKVHGIGAKKAMEYTDKISKSFANFKTAIISKNPSMLNEIFGFTKKTADKLIVALKDKISTVNVLNKEKQTGAETIKNTMVSEAIAGLITLGYKMQQARVAVTNVYENNENITLEDLIKKSLQYL